MKELIATNPANGMKIVERYVKGVKYMKVTPKRLAPLIMNQLKTQLAGQPVDLEESDDGWIRYNKTGTTEGLKKASGKLNEEYQESDMDREDFILKKESEMLKQAGFIVEIRKVV